MREMDRAIDQCTECPVKFEIEYRPFRLNASLKDGQTFPKREWLESRFGKEKTDQIGTMISKRAKEVGVDM